MKEKTLLEPLIGWGLDFLLDEHQTLFLDLFCKKQTKKKFPIFKQNLGLTAKSQYGDFVIAKVL